MAYPELYSDERIVLQAQNIKVKSVSFEGVLTTRRLVLVDSKKNTIPPQEINLATLKDVEAGENAIRDPTITLSIITISGNTRQMILTFSKTSGGERRRECDEWVRTLKQHLKTSIQHPVSQEIPVFDEEPRAPPKPSSTTPRKIEITNTLPQKKKIEVARPMKKIVDAVPAIPVPVETSSLPSGSFCSRCGNRIPAESAFCNRCGTKVLKEGELENQPAILSNIRAAPEPVPSVSLHSMPAPQPPTDKRERPIEQVIHSIEPLIEDSVPRTEPAPLIPSRQIHMQPQPHPEPDVSPEVAPVTTAGSPSPEEAPEVKWPVLSTTDSPVPSFSADTGATPPSPPTGPAPVAPVPPAPKRTSLIAIAVLAIIVVIVIAGAFTFMNSLPGSPAGTTPAPTASATPSPTPRVTTVVTQAPTPIIAATVEPARPSFSPPLNGVWVRVSYLGNFTGSVGTPNRMSDIANTGDQLYQIPTSEGPVVASIQKVDGSDGELTVAVYKDGTLVKQTTTIAPKGIIEIQMLLKPSVTPAPVNSTKAKVVP
jgi:hypothetical protein